MMIRPPFRDARHRGRMAVTEHRLHGGPPPECPWRYGKRLRYWQLGVQDATRLIDELFDLAPRDSRHG